MNSPNSEILCGKFTLPNVSLILKNQIKQTSDLAGDKLHISERIALIFAVCTGSGSEGASK